MTMKEAKKQAGGKGLSLKFVAGIIAAFGLLISVALSISFHTLMNNYSEVMKRNSEYISCKDTARDLQTGSDELTNDVRAYVVTKDDAYMTAYFVESDSGRRQKAVETIKSYLEGTEVYHSLETSLNESLSLMEREYYAMRLMIDVTGRDIADGEIPAEVRAVILSSEHSALSTSEKHEVAIDYVFGDEYAASKEIIIGGVDAAVEALDKLLTQSVDQANANMRSIMISQHVLVASNILFVLAAIILLYIYLIRPVNAAYFGLMNNERVEVGGIREYRFIAQTYNQIRDQNEHHKEKLQYEAEHDKLTGLYNRTGYDRIFTATPLDGAVFALFDIDKFKEVNDEYGHAIGDKVLMRVADALKESFSAEKEHLFRIGGDEFALIVEAQEGQGDIISDVAKRCEKMNVALGQGRKEDRISLSTGIALGTGFDTTDTIFKKADLALYSTKNNGRGDVVIFDESMR